jgi:hypothetical protein
MLLYIAEMSEMWYAKQASSQKVTRLYQKFRVNILSSVDMYFVLICQFFCAHSLYKDRPSSMGGVDPNSTLGEGE